MPLVFHGSRESPSWITAVAPTAEELEVLRRDVGLDVERLEHALDPNERPRVRRVGDTTFIVLRVPLFQGADARVPFTTLPLGILLTPAVGVSIAMHESDVVDRLGAYVDRELESRARHRAALEALDLTGQAFLAALRRMDGEIDAIERRLERSLENREVLELLKYQKSFVDFTDALEAMQLVLESLAKSGVMPAEVEDRELLDDIVIEFRQAHETALRSQSMMSEMMDAFASIISNNLNVVMKFLAAVTVILTLPVTVASFYGMNVALPFARSEHAFAATMGVSLLLAAAVAFYFRRRGWL